MKVYIISAAIVIVLMGFFVFQTDHNRYMELTELLKSTANDCSHAAVLYYDKKNYSEGIKVYDKDSGNHVVLDLLKQTFSEGLTLRDQDINFSIYYFDGGENSTGLLTEYQNGRRVQQKDISYPYRFEEEKTGYSQEIKEPTVVVTIDAGEYNYRLPFVSDPELIRTSAYEEKS